MGSETQGNIAKDEDNNRLATDPEKSGNEDAGKDFDAKVADIQEQKDSEKKDAIREYLEDNAEDGQEITDEMVDEASSRAFDFLVRGASLRCNLGSHERRLNLPICHGIYIKGAPQIHEADCVVGDDQNISSFGVCSSSLHPANKTGLFADEREQLCGENILLELPDEDGDGESDGNVRGLPCNPVIVDWWQNIHDDVLIATNESRGNRPPGENAKNLRSYLHTVTTDSFLICKYEGIISPLTSGQEYLEMLKDEGLEKGDQEEYLSQVNQKNVEAIINEE